MAIKDTSWKKADYPNRRPFYAGTTQYRAYNKLTDFESKEKMMATARGLRKMGYKVIIKKEIGEYIIYFRKR